MYRFFFGILTVLFVPLYTPAFALSENTGRVEESVSCGASCSADGQCSTDFELSSEQFELIQEASATFDIMVELGLANPGDCTYFWKSQGCPPSVVLKDKASAKGCTLVDCSLPANKTKCDAWATQYPTITVEGTDEDGRRTVTTYAGTGQCKAFLN